MKKIFAPIALICSAFSLVALTVSALSFAWFAGSRADVKDEIIDGEIGLRGYFYAGDGLTPSTAYEIVSPIHYYNLTRLQNLGIFPEKRYFQIGHNFGDQIGLACINFDNEGNPSYDQFLDLASLSSENLILPIGGESTPFVGTFNGNGLVLKDLTVSGYPQDIGVFGYVGHQGNISGLVCQNLTIKSLGYNADTIAADHLLFSANVDNIFAENVHEISANMELNFYKGIGENKQKTELKHPNGTSGTTVNNINALENLISDESKLFKGYLEPVYPVRQNEIFEYSWQSSSQLIHEALMDVNGDGENEKVIAFDLTELAASTSGEKAFNSGGDMVAQTRVSLIASVEIDGYTYSRVIQSYLVEFSSMGNTSWNQRGYKMNLYCDYVDTGIVGDYNTNYHHGNNIGLLAGHVDGTITNSFVYIGHFDLNDDDHVSIDAESDSALIGEIGKGVSNSLDPELSLVTNGDIGIMNFSKIYEKIRGDMHLNTEHPDEPYVLAAGRVVPTGETADKAVDYISYDPFINENEDTFALFGEYLRHDSPATGPVHYITKTGLDMTNYSNGYVLDNENKLRSDFNSVDFIWNKMIEDDKENGKDRGLGVFKIITSSVPGANESNYAMYALNELGGSRIENGTPKTKVYFSTAEYDERKGGSFNHQRQTDLPSYSDLKSFEYPFSRDFNYVFELDLEDMSKAGGNDYMWNTNSEFLINYLKTKLIDKFGEPIDPMTPRFGFMFRSSENELLSSLSSYMPIKQPGEKAPYTIKTGETKYYPSNSIAFRIESEYGANVSVVANGADVTIYKNNPDKTQAQEPISALYTMHSGNVSTARKDVHRYFTYDVETGVTGTTAVENEDMESDGGALYGHIFKLDPGDYVLGAKSGTANIYFLAVQGQNNASIGMKEITDIGHEVENVDFLLEEPSSTNAFPYNNSRAKFTFKTTFNSMQGTMDMDVTVYNDKKIMRVTFSESPVYVTYMFLHSKHDYHVYEVNGTTYTKTPTNLPR